MAGLLSLIRLRKHTVEEKQKILSALYREAENLLQKKKVMEEQVEKEKELARGDLAAAAFFARYADSMRRKIGQMDDAIRRINIRIDAAREEVRAAFAEQKKVEIIQRNREEEERKQQEEKETQELSEIALGGFRWKEDE